jgi:formylglycine-generating enzyme required for sulfatase activity
MGKYEVTQAQWEAVTGNNPSRYDGDNRPVEQVSWNDIHEDFLSQIDDDFRLPSESEWEYACRAGTETRFYWGDDHGYDDIGDYAIYYDNASGGTADVGTKRPNSWGLYDMSGNVWEWCEDYYHDSYNGAPADGSAWNDNGSSRVLRGGSWNNNPRSCRSAHRNRHNPPYRLSSYGFRLILVH